MKKPLFNNDEYKNNNSYITKEYKNNKIKEIKTIPESFKDNLLDEKNKDDTPLKKNSFDQCYLSKTVLFNNEDKLIPLQRYYRERNKLKNKNNENDINNNITYIKPYEIINSNEYISKERKTNDNEKKIENNKKDIIQNINNKNKKINNPRKTLNFDLLSLAKLKSDKTLENYTGNGALKKDKNNN